MSPAHNLIQDQVTIISTMLNTAVENFLKKLPEDTRMRAVCSDSLDAFGPEVLLHREIRKWPELNILTTFKVEYSIEGAMVVTFHDYSCPICMGSGVETLYYQTSPTQWTATQFTCSCVLEKMGL